MHTTKRLSALLRRAISEPAASSIDPDDVEVTLRHRTLIDSKPFLRGVYEEWYDHVLRNQLSVAGPLLEIGSGGGFLDQVIPGVITSDVQMIPGVMLTVNASALPFRAASLGAVAMTNVFHHLPDISGFLVEAARCTRPGGLVTMIEPWVTPWSKFIYRNFHHEPFDPASMSWGVAPGKPLSEANGALPWIVFERDRARFSSRFPQFELVSIRPTMPFLYLLSGGVSMRALMPMWTFSFWKRLDAFTAQFVPGSAMFAVITLRRTNKD